MTGGAIRRWSWPAPDFQALRPAAVQALVSSQFPFLDGGTDAHATLPKQLRPTLCNRWFEPVRPHSFRDFAAEQHSWIQNNLMRCSVNRIQAAQLQRSSRREEALIKTNNKKI